MKNLAENNVVRFLNITKKKEGVFANFKAKGVRAGVFFTASISVDIAAAEVSLADPVEKVIEVCAKLAVAEFRRSELQFEGIAAV